MGLALTCRGLKATLTPNQGSVMRSISSSPKDQGWLLTAHVRVPAVASPVASVRESMVVPSPVMKSRVWPARAL